MKNASLLPFCCFLLFSTAGNSQPGVFMPDQVYIREKPPVRTQPTVSWFALHGWIAYGPEDTIANALEKLKPATSITTVKADAPLKIANCLFMNTPAMLVRPGTLDENDSKGKQRYRVVVPEALRFSLDTQYMKISSQKEMHYHQVPEKALLSYFQPFYFSKFEVTNSEYREFVSWVRDSIVRDMLGFRQPNGLIDWKKKIDQEDDDVKAKIESLYLPIEERFFRRRQLDVRKLRYRFYQAPDEVKKQGLETIAVYPDTLSWTNDFSFSYNEPMTNMYTWHPAYDEYPVTGITYFQALAWLDWKTRTEQKKLDAAGKKFTIRYELPSEREWEIAAGAWQDENGQLQSLSGGARSFSDYGWLTDLKLRYEDGGHLMIDRGDTIKQHNYSDQLNYVPLYRGDIVFNERYNSNTTPGNYIFNGAFHTSKSDPSRIKKRTRKGYENSLVREQPDLVNGIAWMGGNVSEWLRNDFSEWEGIYNWRQRQLKAIGGPDAELQAQIEQQSFLNNDKNGKLVRGCNWFDERFGQMGGRNTMGNNAKRFVDPAKAYCTLGFRYVVYVTPK